MSLTAAPIQRPSRSLPGEELCKVRRYKLKLIREWLSSQQQKLEKKKKK